MLFWTHSASSAYTFATNEWRMECQELIQLGLWWDVGALELKVSEDLKGEFYLKSNWWRSFGIH